jgi:hypothetical protein
VVIQSRTDRAELGSRESSVRETHSIPRIVNVPVSTRLRHAAPVAALTLLAAVLRFSTLHVQSFSSDEAVTALLVRADLGSLF